MVPSSRAWGCGGIGHGFGAQVSLRASIATLPPVGPNGAPSSPMFTEPSKSLPCQSTDWQSCGVEEQPGGVSGGECASGGVGALVAGEVWRCVRIHRGNHGVAGLRARLVKRIHVTLHVAA